MAKFEKGAMSSRAHTQSEYLKWHSQYKHNKGDISNLAMCFQLVLIFETIIIDSIQ